MPIRYDRETGARVYDPSEGGGGTAMDGTAMQRLAEALGFYNEAGDLGTAAHFGSPQMASQVLGQLFQGEQAARQQRNQRELMAMQQAGQAATAEARLNAAQQEAAANRDMTRWGKQGDWARYDKQFATQLEKSRMDRAAEMMRMLGLEQGKDRRAEATNQRMQGIADQNLRFKQQEAERKENKPPTPDKMQRPSKETMQAEIRALKKRWATDETTKMRPMPSDADFEVAVLKKYNQGLGLNFQRATPQSQGPQAPRPRAEPNYAPVGFGVTPLTEPEDPEERLRQILGMGW